MPHNEEPANPHQFVSDLLRAEKLMYAMARVKRELRPDPVPHVAMDQWEAQFKRLAGRASTRFVTEERVEVLAQLAARAIEAIQQYTA